MLFYPIPDFFPFFLFFLLLIQFSFVFRIPIIYNIFHNKFQIGLLAFYVIDALITINKSDYLI